MKNWLKKKIAGIIRSLIEETDFAQLNVDVAELNKTKSEFDQRLDGCAASVKGVTSALEKEKATFNVEKTELVKKVDDCVFSAKAATDKTNGLRSEITVLHGEIAEFDQRLDDYAASVKGITSVLEKEKATFNAEKTELVKKVDDCVFSAKAVADKTDELKSEIIVLHGEIAEFDQRLDDCAASVKGITSALEKGKATFNSEKFKLIRNVDNCVFSVKAATNKIGELKNEIIELHSEITELDKGVGDCAASVKGIVDKTADFESKLSKLHKQVEDYSEKNVELEEKVQKLTEALEKLNTIVSSVEGIENWDVSKAGKRLVLTINGVEFTFRYCPPGNFMMGIPDDQGQLAATINEGFRYCSPGNPMTGIPDDYGRREATISEGFWICEVPTTQAQWNAVGIKKANECNFKGAKLPVENVTWHVCDAFIKKLNELGAAPNGWRFKLPTEAQWEYACRAGRTDSTSGVSLDEAAWYELNSGKRTHEVGTKLPNTWGIFDMLGNVWEWTSPKSIIGAPFVLRGGSWNSSELNCHPAIRRFNVPTISSPSVGFRCVLVRR